MKHAFDIHGSQVVISDELADLALPSGRGPSLLEQLYRRLWPEEENPRPSRLAVLTDENTRRHCLPVLREALHEEFVLLEMPAGEAAKNIDTCRQLWTDMLEAGLDRHSLLIVLGGGVPGDLGGFCAATYMRGIPFVFLPTTLLAQTDASIGGKLGIDFAGVKNLVGLFSQPALVFIYPGFLSSLAFRQMLNGWAEVVKHALIADAGLWASIRNLAAPDIATAADWLISSIEVKRRIVEADPLERGMRKLLNFGHTIGHALESLFLGTENELLHGEAVVLGMMAEAAISHRFGLLSEQELNDIESYLRSRYPDTSRHLAKADQKRFLQLLRADKKNRAGSIRCTLIGPIGEGHYDVEVPEEVVVEFLEEQRR